MSNTKVLNTSSDIITPFYLFHAPASRLRGGCDSDDFESDTGYSTTDSEPDYNSDLSSDFDANAATFQVHTDDPAASSNNIPSIYLSHTPAFRLHGGHGSDDGDSSPGYSASDEPGSDAPGPSSKRKRKVTKQERPRKANKGKARACESEADTEVGIRVTRGKGKGKGIYVDEIIHLDSALECWAIPPLDHRIAYIVDLADSPECINSKTSTVDAFIEKECQDSFSGPTGSREDNKLAEVLILDDGGVVYCRRSNLSSVV
ncbi:hypothetical protein C8R44DRAFT_920294 [Mycena epipterygia]|nr:hypothetical protein C8R44DRAFT_920294 [Mycena epipterygia]